MQPIDRFFAFMRERHSIYEQRQALKPWPWTQDEILQKYRFTNVDRELDATTVWFRGNVREPLRRRKVATQLFAAIAFRWFNRMDVGEVMVAHNLYLDWEYGRAMEELRRWRPNGPWVTGAYIIKAYDGVDKLTGVCRAIDNAWHKQDALAAAIVGANSLEGAVKALGTLPYLGPFMAYEVACDMRWTKLLEHAHDIYTWANPGPGAARGLSRVHGRKLRQTVPRGQMVEEMAFLRDEWEQDHLGPDLGRRPEMRDVEHSLCEFDKYERVRLGQGRPRQVFRRP